MKSIKIYPCRFEGCPGYVNKDGKACEWHAGQPRLIKKMQNKIDFLRSVLEDIAAGCGDLNEPCTECSFVEHAREALEEFKKNKF